MMFRPVIDASTLISGDVFEDLEPISLINKGRLLEGCDRLAEVTYHLLPLLGVIVTVLEHSY